MPEPDKPKAKARGKKRARTTSGEAAKASDRWLCLRICMHARWLPCAALASRSVAVYGKSLRCSL